MIVIVLLFTLFACYLMSGRGSFLIAGFNTMSAEQKARYDEKKLCRLTGVLMLAAALYWALIEFTALNAVMLTVLFGLLIILFVTAVNFTDIVKK